MATATAAHSSESAPAKDPTFKEAEKAHANLIKEWNKRPEQRDMIAVGNLLEQAKLKLANMKHFLPSSGKNVPRNDLLLARDVLEVGAFYSIAKEIPDTKMFERYMSQLKTYYFDYGSILKDTPHANILGRKFELLTANLLFLLAEGRTAEFHIELELILTPSENANEILQNEFVKRAVEIGKSLEEGCYYKVCQIQGSEIKSPACQFFVAKLIETSRFEIAETLEHSYEKIIEKEALERLHLKDRESLHAFANLRGWDWNGQHFCFNIQLDENATVPAKRIVLEALAYARELERII